MMKKIGLLVLLIIFSLVTGCGQTNQESGSQVAKSPYKKTEFLLGTVVTIKIYDEGKEKVLEPVFKRIRSLEEQITVNDNESEINKINENTGVKPVKVSDDIFNLIDAGTNYSRKSNGSFDISIGPLTSLWHIGYPDARKPTQSEIDAVLPLIDYQQIELNEEEKSVFLKKKGMELDLGAIAKGFIADEVVSILKENNVKTAIIDLGGNIYVMGENPNGKGWKIGIQDPFSPRGETVGRIMETNKSIVTSGVYERFIEVNGKKYHHLLNPKDGYPFENDIAGVSIVTNKSIDGDALSTTVFSKGLKEGMKFIEGIEGAEAIFISNDKKVYMTSGLKNNFELTNSQFEIGELPPMKEEN